MRLVVTSLNLTLRLEPLHNVLRLQFAQHFIAPHQSEHRGNGLVKELADCVVYYTGGVVPHMLREVTCVIHRTEVDVLGHMSIATHCLVHQRPIHEAGCDLDRRE